jgi:hypothetical protein
LVACACAGGEGVRLKWIAEPERALAALESSKMYARLHELLHAVEANSLDLARVCV